MENNYQNYKDIFSDLARNSTFGEYHPDILASMLNSMFIRLLFVMACL